MFAPRRPDKKKAKQELQRSIVLFGTLCVSVRAIPYILHLYQMASS